MSVDPVHMLRLTHETHKSLKANAERYGLGMASFADALLREGLAERAPVAPAENRATQTLVWHPVLHRLVRCSTSSAAAPVAPEHESRP